MINRLNCSSGNTIGVEEYISYSEIDPTGTYAAHGGDGLPAALVGLVASRVWHI